MDIRKYFKPKTKNDDKDKKIENNGDKAVEKKLVSKVKAIEKEKATVKESTKEKSKPKPKTTTATKVKRPTTKKIKKEEVEEEEYVEEVKDDVEKKPINKKEKKSAVTTSLLDSNLEDNFEVTPVKKKFNYFQHKNAAPSALGSKDIPTGKPDSLIGKTFVLTGQLSSITREDTADLIKRLGGRVTGSVSSKTSFLVAGDEPGDSKLTKAKSLKTKILNEDQLFDYIRSFEDKAEDKVKAEVKVEEKEDKTEKKNDVKVELSKPAVKIEVKEATKPIEKLVTTELGPEFGRETELWVDKYKPKTMRDLCGNKKMADDICAWLRNWDPDNDSKTPRAVLISGPPGIGKTSCAHIALKTCGFNPIEFNASDTRSKKSIEAMLGDLVNNRSITEFFSPDKRKAEASDNNRPALILDEIDGMSGGDRGGVAEVIKYIKRTKVPIICICNDRQSSKVKSLVNHCIDIRFRRPLAASVRDRITQIAEAEGLEINNANTIEKLVQTTQGDIRQIINLLSSWRLNHTTMDFDQGKDFAKDCEKHTVLNPFDICSKYLSSIQYQGHSITDRLDFYFHDYSLAPLMVQENYIHTQPQAANSLGFGDAKEAKVLELMAEAADNIAYGDIVGTSIMREQNWGLMPVHAAYSCAIPSYLIHGSGTGMYNFPSWLGQNSKANKNNRLLREAHLHIRSRISGDKNALRLNYVPFMFDKLITPLVALGQEGIEPVIEFMDGYYMDLEDRNTMLDLVLGGKQGEALLKQVPTAVKTAFTRTYNKMNHPTIVTTSLSASKVKVGSGDVLPDLEDVMIEDTTVDADFEDSPTDDIKDDKFISSKKPAAKRKATTSTKSKKPRTLSKKA